jgi:threonylcarbamoyladenosine tRNA methylthiotransferase MtaB
VTVQIITFGCRLNNYESELIKQYAAKAGLTDTVIFNSCAVTSEAERQLRQSIRKTKRNNPRVKIIVTGCAAQVNPDKYRQMSEVDKVLGNMEKVNPISYLSINDSEKVIVNDIMSVKETAYQLIEGFEGRARAFLQVQNGCDHRCNFCTIPYARGNSRSVPLGPIVEQTEILIKNGYKEIVLTGVDMTSYGHDLPGSPSLGQMIKRLLALVPDLSRLRLSSIDVAEIDDDLFNLITTEKRLMPHIHLSMQSGDNMILKRMKRRHSREDLIEFCRNARSVRKDLVFGADIIAGFPTETDEMFSNTLNIIEEADLTYLHVFPYSERDGTPASKMPQVSKDIRKLRAKILREFGDKKLLEHLTRRIGKTLEVIVEKDHMARAEDFSLVFLKNGGFASGDAVLVEILDATPKHLIAEIIPGILG